MISSDSYLTTDGVLVLTVHYLKRVVPLGQAESEQLYQLVKLYEAELERRGYRDIV